MLFQLILSVIIFSLVTVVSFIEIERRKKAKEFKHIPTAKECPILGTTLFFKFYKMNELKRYMDEIVISPICKLFVGPMMIIIVSDPEALSEIAHSPAFSERGFFIRFFPWPKGLISIEHDDWKRQRRILNPAFSQRTAISLIPIINQHSNHYENLLAAKVNGPAFDLFEITAEISYEHMLETTFRGYEPGKMVSRQILNKVIDIGLERSRMPIFWPDKLWKLTNLYKSMSGLKEIVDKNYLPKIHTRIEHEENYKNFFDVMKKHLNTENGLTFEELYHNSIQIIFAGFETSALAIAYTCLALAIHPEVDAKLEAELKQNFQPGDTIDFDLLKRLPYLDMVLKESLRLFPPAPAFPREALYDIEIKGIGLIQKGTIIGEIFYALHRWKHIWGNDAESFKPERFAPEEVEKRHPGCFMPFGSGPRQCIGMQQAIVNVKVALVHILSKFKFTSDLKMEDFTYTFVLSMQLNQKHMVQVHRRS